MKKTSLLLISVFYTFALLSNVAAASRCTGCHEEVLTDSRERHISHRPVVKEQCEQCHLAGKKVSAPVKKSPLAAKKEKREKVNWFWKSSGRSEEHLLRLSSAELSGKLFLNAIDANRRSLLKELSLPNFSNLPKKDAEKKPPVLSGLQVTGVRRAISVTATLQWQTDEYADAVVYYGIDNLQSTKHVSKLSKQHSCNLMGLASGKTYQVKVVARDLFDNVIESPVLTFSTEKSFWNPPSTNFGKRVLLTNIKLDWEIFRLANDYLFVIKTDRPVAVSLGRTGRKEDKNLATRKVDTGGFSHVILKSAFDTNISVCKACHVEVKEEYSHPIKVKAPKGMVIPEDFALLPDKTLSCMTCHIQHSSDNEYRLRKPKKSELCRSCHSNY